MPQSPKTTNLEAADDQVGSVYSIFHSDWWLDAATDGRWQRSEIRNDGKVIASWPYLIKVRLGVRIATQPVLTRSLGPAILKGNGKDVAEFRREAEIVRELLAQLPRVHYFAQTLDPKSSAAIHLKTLGFTCMLDYSFRTPPGQSRDLLWSNMRDKTRNLIRSAENAGISVREVSDLDQFLHFYEHGLKRRGVANVYTSEAMRRICITALERHSAKVLGAYSAAGLLLAAILIVWDHENSYYLLSSRAPQTHSGAISLLIWHGMQDAAACGRGFDFDGTPTPGTVRFLSGFNANLVPRIQVVRGPPLLRFAHTVNRRMASRSMFGKAGSLDAPFY